MGGKREYTAIFSIGGRLLGSFRGAMAQAQARMRGLAATARRVGGGMLKLGAIFSGIFATLGTYLAANILGKIFGTASQEAIEAEQRTRALMGALMLNQKVAKGGTAEAKKQLDLIYAHNAGLQKRGVLHKDILDTMAVQLAMKGGIPPGAISDSIDAMQNLLVATKGVAASEEDGKSMAQAWSAAVARGRLMGLANQGLQITKEQTKAFGKLKTVQARQLWLMEHIGKAYQNVNADAAKTPVGRIQLFRNAIQDLAQDVGDELVPAQAELADAWRDALPELKPMLVGGVKLLFAALKRLGEYVRTTLIPAWRDMKAWAEKNKDWLMSMVPLVTKLAITFGVLTAAVYATNAALAVSPVGWIAIGIGAAVAMYLAWDKISPAISRAWDKMKQVPVVGPILTAINSVWDAMKNVPVLGSIVQALESIYKAIGKFFLNPLGSVKDAIYGIKTAWDYMTNAVLSFHWPSWLSAIPGMPSVPRGATPSPPATPPGLPAPDLPPSAIPGAARGGIFRKPMLAQIAERGPEAVVPLGRGGGIGGTTLSVTNNVTINGDATEAQQRALVGKLRDAGRDFVSEFKRAQTHERRLSYESGYS